MIRTLTVRLTLWFSALFSLLSLAAFTFTYMSLTSNLKKRVDAFLTEDAQEITEVLRSQGQTAVPSEIDTEAASVGVGRVFYRLFSPRLRLLATSDLSNWHDLDRKPERLASNTTSRFQTLILPHRKYWVRTLTQKLDSGYILQIGYLGEGESRLLEHFRESFATSFSIVLLGAALIGFWVASRAMAGVNRIRQTADRITQGDFSQRVPLGRYGEEIDNLARTFNQMQERVQTLIRELQDVTNNIAHDLRSPLTRIRGLAETTLTGRQDLADYREMAGSVIEESDRMVNMINTMLEIAEIDAGLRKVPESSVDMAAIARDVGELFFTVAEDKGLEVRAKIASARLVVQGDRTRLQRAIANLVDNAIKYTPRGGKVTIHAKGEHTLIEISIADTGPGIPKEEKDHIFDRFYRLDQSRSTPGNGLGLSLVQAVIRAHGGEVLIESEAGRGSVFTIRLPRLYAQPCAHPFDHNRSV